MIPNDNDVLASTDDKLDTFMSKCMKLCSNMNIDDNIKNSCNAISEGLLSSWHENSTAFQHLPNTLNAKDLKRNLDGLVVSPIDKMQSDMVIMCKHKYSLAVDQFIADTGNYREIDDATVKKWEGKLVRINNRCNSLPFCGLKKSEKHKFGILRLWFKSKNLKSSNLTWSSFKFRPLVSYYHHHWKRCYKLISMFCSHIVSSLKLGISVSNTKDVLREVKEFNAFREEELEEGDVDLYNRDIEDFFTNISRKELLEAVDWAIEKVKEKNSTLKYFVVPREESIRKVTGKREGRFVGWRRITEIKSRKNYFSPFKKKKTRSISFVDIRRVMKAELKYNVVYIKGKPYTACDGLGMGCGFSAGGSSLVVAKREWERARRMNERVRRERRAKERGFRWMDDIFYMRVRNMSKESKSSLESDVCVDAYGDRLKLKKVISNVAFGMNFTIDSSNNIIMKPQQKYIESFEDTSLNAKNINVFCGSQFTSRGIREGVIKGYIYRILDNTNMDADSLNLELHRLFSELLLADIPAKEIVRSFNKCVASTPVQFTIDQSLLKMSKKELKYWNLLYDYKEALNHQLQHDRVK